MKRLLLSAVLLASLFPHLLGQKLRLYEFLRDIPFRDDAQDAEARRLYAELQREGIEVEAPAHREGAPPTR